MIYDFRMKYGLSKTDLAKLLGVTPATIYRWETKGDTPSEANMAKLRMHMQQLQPAEHIDGQKSVN